MDFTEYVKPELLLLIPVLVFIGYCIKAKTSVDNKNIPWILGVAGIGLALVWVLASSLPFQSVNEILTAVFTAATQGALVAAAAVFANQIYKQGHE